MSADNDAATKSPSKVFSLKSRFLGGGKPKTVPKDETPEAEAKAETPGPGSSLLAAMLGSDDDGEASITIRKASADEADAAPSPEAAVSETAEEHSQEAAPA